LNQYSTGNGNSASYDVNGKMPNDFDGSIYTYDAQNRLISATKNGTTETFKYDALNRLVTRTRRRLSSGYWRRKGTAYTQQDAFPWGAGASPGLKDQ